MRRRDLIAMLGGAAIGWPLRASPQTVSGLPLVAVLWPSTPEIETDIDAALRGGLKEGGFVDGKNFVFAMRYADADFDRLAPLAAELAALQPRVIIAAPDEAVLAAHKAAPTVSLVFNYLAADPVALGLADSFARPGGTVTGTTSNASGGAEAIIGKRLGLLKEIVPRLARIGVIVLAYDNPRSVLLQKGAERAANRLGLAVVLLPVLTLDDVEAAFASGLHAGVDAFYFDGSPLLFVNRAKVAEFAARAGKPTVGVLAEQARAGFLMSYASDLADSMHRTGIYVAKILAGAKPSELPIEQASKFTFVINLKTAKALGITVPPRLMLLADELVE